MREWGCAKTSSAKASLGFAWISGSHSLAKLIGKTDHNCFLFLHLTSLEYEPLKTDPLLRPLFPFDPRPSHYVRVKSSHFPPGGSQKPRWHIRVATRWHLLESSQAAGHMSPNSQEAAFSASVSKQSTSWVPHRRYSTLSQLAPWPWLERLSRNESERLGQKKNLPWGDPLSPEGLESQGVAAYKLIILEWSRCQPFPKAPSVPQTSKGTALKTMSQNEDTWKANSTQLRQVWPT